MDALKSLGLELAVALLPYLVAALSTLLVAWLRSKLLAVEARNVATQVELEASLDPELRGEKKMARAKELLAERTRALAALRPEAIIERALPAAREAAAGPISRRPPP